MTKIMIAGALVVTGLINLYPVIGVLGAQQLSALYGIPFSETNLLILMRHRAVLFGLLGGFSLYAAFRTELQVPAMLAGLISMLAFVGLALWGGEYNPQLKKVVIADVVAAVLLGVALILHLVSVRRR